MAIAAVRGIDAVAARKRDGRALIRFHELLTPHGIKEPLG